MVSLVSDIAVGISALIVAGVAIVGLRTWRKEMTGKAKFDIARNCMLLAYKLKADFEWARFIMTSSQESADRQPQEDESPRLSRVLDEWYAKSRRLQPLSENLRALQESGWEAEIVLGVDAGKQVSDAIKAIRQRYGELSAAITSYFEEKRRKTENHEVEVKPDWLMELRRLVYSSGEDDFSKQIDDAVDQLASALKPYVG